MMPPVFSQLLMLDDIASLSHSFRCRWWF